MIISPQSLKEMKTCFFKKRKENQQWTGEERGRKHSPYSAHKHTQRGGIKTIRRIVTIKQNKRKERN